MMNGTPEKHSFSSSEEGRRKQRGGGGTERKMEGKDRMGWCRYGEYIILLHTTTVTRRQ